MTRTFLKRSLLALVAAVILLPAGAAAGDREEERLRDAAESFKTLLETPDAGIPEKLVEDCRCVAVFPGVVKGALGWGGRRGHGVVSCRDTAGTWSPPSFMTLTGGSFGFQIGVEKADVVLLVMNERGVRSLLKSKFTLGAKGGVAAGPVGRTVEGGTDIKLEAEIYSYARSKGLFAGLSLEGAKVSADEKAIERFYGAAIEPETILFARKVPDHPKAAKEFLSALP